MAFITKRTDYALRCLVDLAQTSSGGSISVHTLAEKEDISEDLLQKIMHHLTLGGLVRSSRGRTGGFRLVKPADSITVLKVIEVMEGQCAINRCFMDGENCQRQDVCHLRTKLKDVQERFLQFFSDVTLADLAQHGDRLVSE